MSRCATVRTKHFQTISGQRHVLQNICSLPALLPCNFQISSWVTFLRHISIQFEVQSFGLCFPFIWHPFYQNRHYRPPKRSFLTFPHSRSIKAYFSPSHLARISSKLCTTCLFQNSTLEFIPAGRIELGIFGPFICINCRTLTFPIHFDTLMPFELGLTTDAADCNFNRRTHCIQHHSTLFPPLHSNSIPWSKSSPPIPLIKACSCKKGVTMGVVSKSKSNPQKIAIPTRWTNETLWKRCINLRVLIFFRFLFQLTSR